MALSLVLLTGAGLMIESVVRLLHVNPGFDPQNLLFAHPGLFRDGKYDMSKNHSGEVEALTYEQMREQFSALPGVKAVGVIKFQFAGTGYTIDGSDAPVALMPGGTGVGDGDAFRAMRTPLLAGRYLEKDDIGDKVGTVVINDTMARLCWSGESPLGKRFRNKGGRVFEVVGVMADARIDSYDGKIEPIFFRPYYEQAWTGGRGPFFIVRTESDPKNLIAAVRDEMKAVEPNMTTPWFEVIRQTLYDATVAQRTYMLYLVIFAAVGLMLAAIGVYGVLAYSVARRTREIGIRMAVGAEPGQVLRMVMKEGLQLAALGAVSGLVAAFWLTQLLRSELFGVSPTDPGVMAGAVVVLGIVAAVACLLPAIRAVRINPMTALRYE
jgi:putative ABC transport system permease protein